MSQATEPLKFSNDHLSIVAEKSPGCRVKLTVDIKPLASEAAYKQAVKKINKEVSIPGFRKGRAPDKAIIENYGKYIDNEWKEILLQKTFKDSCELSKLFPFNENSIKKPKVDNLKKETGGQVTFEWEHYPDLPKLEMKDVKLKKVEQESVTDDDVKNLIEQVQFQYAEWNDVEGRPVKEADFVELDIENLDNPGQFICQETRFEVDKEKMGAWMHKLVLGTNIGDVVEGHSEAGPEVKNKDNFKSTHCKITIKNILNPKLPEIDDELAKKVGAENVDDLHVKARENLNHQSEEEVKEEMRNQVEDYIKNQYIFDVPESLFNAQKQTVVHGILQQMKAADKTDDECKEHIEKKNDDIESDVLKTLRFYFMTRNISQDENIVVDKEELLSETLRRMYSPEHQQGEQPDPKMIQEQAHSHLLTKKVIDYIVENATIEE